MSGPVDGIRPATPPPRPWRFPTGRVRFSRVVAGLAGVGVVAGVVLAVMVGSDLRLLFRVRSMLPPGHYLVLFQNNAELRSSGGFLGSFAVVDIGRFGVDRYMIDTNIYKRDAAFTQRYAIAMPPPLMPLSDKLAMRDANYDLDFRDAARRVAWFYEQEGGGPVDGVVAVNASVVQDVLRLTGPVAVPGLAEPLTADTFFSVLSAQIEHDYFLDPAQQAVNEPKAILADLAHALVRRAAFPLAALRLPRLLGQEFAERHVQVFHVDPLVESRILGYGWGGAVADTASDYLLINNELVAPTKSNRFMSEMVRLAVDRQADGSYRHVLSVERTHTGVATDAANASYLRAAVPKGSLFVAAELNGQPLAGVDETVEAGKTVFGTRVTTDPGYTSTLKLTYVVPSLPAPYSLRVQKQSGVMSERVSVALDGSTLFAGDIVHDIVIGPGSR